jgi:hypothetical protein
MASSTSFVAISLIAFANARKPFAAVLATCTRLLELSSSSPLKQVPSESSVNAIRDAIGIRHWSSALLRISALFAEPFVSNSVEAPAALLSFKAIDAESAAVDTF